MSGPRVRTGLDRLVEGDGWSELRSAAAGLVLHPASVTANLEHAADALLGSGLRLRALFGPQHGARGEKQDNMIESGHYTDHRTGLPVYSLYSRVRKPTADMLSGLDVLLFDLQDVGVRVYTFVWTMVLAMEACAEAGLRFVVLDRPNPVGGLIMEGPLLRRGFESFVGLHPVPLRHGLTAGELARWLNEARGIGCELEVVPMEGWTRSMGWADTGLTFVPPSPNLPTPASCGVYPGMVLFEGTCLSEGRGTTRPFELSGAPWLDPHGVVDTVEERDRMGVHLRPCWFEPTFQKHAGRMCGGVHLHVTDPARYRPVRTAVALLRAMKAQGPEAFRWRDPPYEYEERLPPIDILWGGDGLRSGIDAGASVDDVLAEEAGDCADFAERVAPYRLYSER